MINVNDTADRAIRPMGGIYVMTDVFGNQGEVKVTTTKNSMKIKMLEPAPTTETNETYKEFLYNIGSTKIDFADADRLYCWNDTEYKVYPKEGSEPLYFEKRGQNKIGGKIKNNG